MDAPYSEILYAAPQEDIESFCQTWLFFGLLAEVLGLNESPTGQPSVLGAQAGRDIAAMHRGSIVEEDGVRYITGSLVLQSVPQKLERIQQAPDLPQRALHLAEMHDLYLQVSKFDSVLFQPGDKCLYSSSR